MQFQIPSGHASIAVLSSEVRRSIAPNDSRVVYSPVNWDFNGSVYAQSNNPDAYLDLAFTGTSFVLGVDVSMVTAAGATTLQYPAIKWVVDGGAPTRYQLLSTDTQVMLASSLSTGTHTLRIYFAGIEITLDRWNTPSMALRITGFLVDTTADLATITTPTDIIVGWADSVGEGEEALGSGVSVANQDASVTFWFVLAAGLNAKVGAMSFSLSGYTVGGSGNVPSWPNSYSLKYAGVSRMISSHFISRAKALIIVLGLNDSGDITTNVTTAIGLLRAASGSDTAIFICVPWRGDHAAQIAAGVAAAGDSRAYAINTGTTSYSNHDPHLTTAGHAAYGADLLRLMQPLVSQTFGMVSPQLTAQPSVSGSYDLVMV